MTPDRINTTVTRWRWEIWRDGKRTQSGYEPTKAKARAVAVRAHATTNAYWKTKGRTVELAAYVQRVDTIEYRADAL